jgi:hypothetical protein
MIGAQRRTPPLRCRHPGLTSLRNAPWQSWPGLVVVGYCWPGSLGHRTRSDRRERVEKLGSRNVGP